MTSTTHSLPQIVSAQEWQAAHEAMLKKEKDFTHAKDALAAQRRRQPMTHIDNYEFEGADGKVTLLELFRGRPQLLIYHFMFAPSVHGWPTAGCPGCSMFMDNVGQFSLTHLAQRDVSFAIVSLAPLENLLAYQKRMSWTAPWVSSAKSTFNKDLGLSKPQGEDHGLSVFLRDAETIYRTYFTTARGLEIVGGLWSFLDLTPFGRQENWEDSPAGRPQTEPYTWWRRHDEY